MKTLRESRLLHWGQEEKRMVMCGEYLGNKDLLRKENIQKGIYTHSFECA